MSRKNTNYAENIGFLRKYYEIPAKILADYLEIEETDYLLKENHKKPFTLHQVEKITVLFLQPKADFINGKVAINFDKDFYKVYSVQDLKQISIINQIWLNQFEMEKLNTRKEKNNAQKTHQTSENFQKTVQKDS